jgi:hypothetical protein
VLNHPLRRRWWAWTRESARETRAGALEARIAAGDEERWGRDAPPSSARVGEAHTFFRRFAEQARELERARPFREWVEWLSGFLETDPWKIESHVYRVPEDRYDVARLDAAGLAGMREILRQWREALATWGGGEEMLDVAGFESRLREMLSGDAALWTPPGGPCGWAKIGAARARHRVHRGLAGDAFRCAPRSPVLDDDAHAARRRRPAWTCARRGSSAARLFGCWWRGPRAADARRRGRMTTAPSWRRRVPGGSRAGGGRAAARVWTARGGVAALRW